MPPQYMATMKRKRCVEALTMDDWRDSWIRGEPISKDQISRDISWAEDLVDEYLKLDMMNDVQYSAPPPTAPAPPSLTSLPPSTLSSWQQQQPRLVRFSGDNQQNTTLPYYYSSSTAAADGDHTTPRTGCAPSIFDEPISKDQISRDISWAEDLVDEYLKLDMMNDVQYSAPPPTAPAPPSITLPPSTLSSWQQQQLVRFSGDNQQNTSLPYYYSSSTAAADRDHTTPRRAVLDTTPYGTTVINITTIDVKLMAAAAAYRDDTTRCAPSVFDDDHSGPAAKKWGRWTEDEHRMFLIGLEIYNKGQWKIISKEIFSGKKTEAQITSHAQKYFQRQQLLQEQQADACGDGANAMRRKRQRRIHDINKVDDAELDGLITKKLISEKVVERLRAARSGTRSDHLLHI
ncbi:hypothetical protein Dimus_031362 [Dionaea muscipula]